MSAPLPEFGLDSDSFGEEGRLILVCLARPSENTRMSREQLYQWQAQIAHILPELGYWQSLVVALYSVGMVIARQSSASRVAEVLGWMSKPESLRRRFERWVANERVSWQGNCQDWSRWVLARVGQAHPVLLVDETKLGNHLRVMVVGLAYQSCCLPLVFWAYVHMPCGQVELITTLLGWIDAVLPVGCQPLLQADRGIGTSPDLIRAVDRLGWHYLFRVQNDTRCCTRAGHDRPLRHLVKRGECWRGSGVVFKKAGWLAATVLVVWQPAYDQAWCLVTNAAYVSDFTYALRYWQEAAFRDLKSDGWQWQTSRVWTPAHAQRLLLVMTLAYAYTLTLGTLVLTLPPLFRAVARPGRRQHFSLFRLGLRLFALVYARYATWLVPSLLAQAADLPEPFRLCVGV